MYTNYPKFSNYKTNDIGKNYYDNYYDNYNYSDDERFFWAPFVVGGLAGTALGFGIANNNQINHQTYYPYPPMGPVYSYPVYPTYSSNTYYYS